MANTTVAQERIDGALACIAALANLERSAENLPDESNDARVFMDIQLNDAEKITSLMGAMTPRQEGAFRAMAEYIHTTITTGTTDLSRWTPFVATTDAERQTWIDSVNTDN